MARTVDINTVFTRLLLKRVHADVKAAHPAFNLRTAAWVWDAGFGCWEFHGPDKYYWHGHAHDAYEARAKGWMAWMDRHPAVENEQRTSAVIAATSKA